MITIYIYRYAMCILHICISMCFFLCVSKPVWISNHQKKATSTESFHFSVSARTGEEFQISEYSEDSEKSDLSCESPGGS